VTTTRERLEMIRDDAVNDAKTLDGLAFSGATVGRRFGEVLAMVHALANVCLEQQDRLDALEKYRGFA